MRQAAFMQVQAMALTVVNVLPPKSLAFVALGAKAIIMPKKTYSERYLIFERSVLQNAVRAVQVNTIAVGNSNKEASRLKTTGRIQND
jgi:hypothetical protein